MDAVIDTQPPDGPEPASAEIIDFDAWRRAQGHLPAQRDPDPYPWAYTFGPASGG